MSDPQNESGTCVGHTKADETDVYVGRGPNGRHMLSTWPTARGWLGNPFTLDDHDREESIEKFREAFEDRLDLDTEFRAAVHDLRGKTLGCWCQRLDADAPACHAEVISEWADRLAEYEEEGYGERRSDESITYLYGPDTVRGRADRAGHHVAQRTLSEFEDGTNDDPLP